MTEFLQLVGEAKAHVNIFGAKDNLVSERTSRAYEGAYRSFLRGKRRNAVSNASAVWLRAAIRHCAVRRLTAATGELERAVSAGDVGTAHQAAGVVRAMLDLLYAHPQGRAGRRPRGGSVRSSDQLRVPLSGLNEVRGAVP